MWGKTQQVAGYTDLTHLTVQGKLCVKVIVCVNKTIYLSCKILPQNYCKKISLFFAHYKSAHSCSFLFWASSKCVLSP